MNSLNNTGNSSWPWFPASCALAGIIVFIFATYGPPASSSGFISLLKGILQDVLPEYAASKAHYAMIPGPDSWLFTFVLGMSLGGFIAGRTSHAEVEDVPRIWILAYGPNRWKRYLASFIGGFLLLFSSRLAGGCTLGLFISGTSQLAVSGVYFGLLIFLTAMLTARIVYGKMDEEER